MNPTLVPAYGRDYKAARDVKTDFYAGKDFLISDFSHPYDGKATSLRDMSEGTVNIRYGKLRKVCLCLVKV